MRAVERFRDHTREVIFILGASILVGGLFFIGLAILSSIYVDTSMIADEPYGFSEIIIGYGMLATPIVIGSALMFWARRIASTQSESPHS